MLSRLERPGCFQMTVIYLYVLLSIAICPCVTALRGHTPADYKFADALWTKAASPRDDIVRPASERIVGKTNVR